MSIALRTVAAFLLLWSATTAADPSPRITIIIDDLGYATEPGRRAVGLPGPVVLAVLPHTPRGRRLAELAHANDKEVLLHLPLESVDRELQVGPGLITLDMSRRQFAGAVAESLSTVPHAIGINGHRGSLLSRHPGHMAWLMEELDVRDMLFVDSYTTHLSVALDMAREAGIPATRRHVFLDSDPHPAAIAREFERLKLIAVQRGTAVGIGHPYPETLDFLEGNLSSLHEQGITLVGIADLLGDYVKRDNDGARHAIEPVSP